MTRPGSTGEPVPAPEPGRTGPSGRFGWRGLLLFAGWAVVASLVIPMLTQLNFEPFILAMVAPVAVGLLLALRWPRVGIVWVAVVSLALLVFSAPFLLDALAHPEALADFIPLVVFTVGLLVAVLVAVPAFREVRMPARPSRAPGAVAVAAGVAVAVAAVLSVVASTGIESVPPESGDLLVVTEDIAFLQDEISVPAGEVAVHVENRDGTRHTFTIDALGVDLEVPPGSSQRTTFQAPPGTYRFYCRPHTPGMEGQLVVT